MMQGKVLIKKEKINPRDSSRIKNCIDHFNSVCNAISVFPFDLEDWKDDDFKDCVTNIKLILLDFKNKDEEIMR